MRSILRYRNGLILHHPLMATDRAVHAEMNEHAEARRAPPGKPLCARRFARLRPGGRALFLHVLSDGDIGNSRCARCSSKRGRALQHIPARQQTMLHSSLLQDGSIYELAVRLGLHKRTRSRFRARPRQTMKGCQCNICSNNGSEYDLAAHLQLPACIRLIGVDRPKGITAHVAIWRTEDRMVKDVEGLGSELELFLVPDGERSNDR